MELRHVGDLGVEQLIGYVEDPLADRQLLETDACYRQTGPLCTVKTQLTGRVDRGVL